MELSALVTLPPDAQYQRRVLNELTHEGRALRQAARNVPATLAAGLDMQPDDVIELRPRVQALVAALRGPARANDR